MLAARDERLPRHPARSVEINPSQVDLLEASENIRREEPAPNITNHLEEYRVVVLHRYIDETGVGQPSGVGVGGAGV